MDRSGSPPPDMEPFYARFYQAIASSPANAIYSERLYGKNMGQQGFAELSHLDHLAQVAGLDASTRALDLGCGNGMIAEYLSDQTGACIVGIDYIPDAIRQARERTREKINRLQFEVMDIGQLNFPAASFDCILAVDTLYFTPLEPTLKQIFQILKPGGRLVTFWSQSCEPWKNLAEFDKDSILPDRTDLALVLQALGFPYQTWEYSRKDYEHACRKLQISEELCADFEAEGNQFLSEMHFGEGNGVKQAYEAGAHGRYLYRVDKT